MPSAQKFEKTQVCEVCKFFSNRILELGKKKCRKRKTFNEGDEGMPIFLGLAFVGIVILVGGALFGHDHDHDMHFDHDHDHSGHDMTHGGEPTVSIFSLKVIGSFIMAFGCGGATARWADYGWISSSLIGMASGVLLGAVFYGAMRLMYSQQSDSLVSTDQAVGQTGVVVVEIGAQSPGSVNITLSGQQRSYLARSSSGIIIPKGREVKVVRTNGGEVVVEVNSVYVQ